MTQAYNLSQLANNLDSSGRLDATDGLVNAVPVANGGTGAANATSARSNLGLGSMAVQNADSVAVTGGSISGITDLAVADGGTGASSAAAARSNLGVPSTSGSGASGTWDISISGNAATATTATNSTNGLGVGQTWQDVTASRANGVTYTNSTAKPIFVAITCVPNPGSLTIDGVQVWYYNANVPGYFAAVVPAGSSYVLTSTTMLKWIELR